jgi:hypothetical protein
MVNARSRAVLVHALFCGTERAASSSTRPLSSRCAHFSVQTTATYARSLASMRLAWGRRRRCITGRRSRARRTCALTRGAVFSLGYSLSRAVFSLQRAPAAARRVRRGSRQRDGPSHCAPRVDDGARDLVTGRCADHAVQAPRCRPAAQERRGLGRGARSRWARKAARGRCSLSCTSCACARSRAARGASLRPLRGPPPTSCGTRAATDAHCSTALAALFATAFPEDAGGTATTVDGVAAATFPAVKIPRSWRDAAHAGALRLRVG